MQRILTILLILLYSFLSLRSNASAQIFNGHKSSEKLQVTAMVGEFFLNLSGYVSPFASIVLTSDGYFLRATVADQSGNFYLTATPIKKGFSHFCLEAIDYKRLGSSLTCFTIPPAKDSVTKKDIFLPPTLGLQRATIGPGGEAVTFGYTMSKAMVKLHISNGKLLTTNADTQGYFEYHINNLQPGNYNVYAKAYYKGKESLSPSKKLQFTALSWWELILANLKALWDGFINWLLSLPLGPLWFALPFLVLITIFIIKLTKPELIPWLSLDHFLALFKRKDKRLHHWWFVGFSKS